MRLLICVPILLAACVDPDRATAQKSAIELAGYLESSSLREASGLAYSNVRDDLIWAINDDGPADLYALGPAGEKRGKVRIEDAKNRDWEDLASFTLDGAPYLLVGDIGDNQARRKDVTLYVVKEPRPDDDEVDIEWEIEFTYPEGPRDAESIAVDPGAKQIYVLSKRDIPARLYALPLQPGNGDRITAEYIGTVSTLPQPSRSDVNNAAALKNWHWQPTGMDIGKSAILVLTYRAVYLFSRGGEALTETLEQPPLGLRIDGYPGAEAIAFGHTEDTAYVTIEKQHAPLLRINLRETTEK